MNNQDRRKHVNKYGAPNSLGCCGLLCIPLTRHRTVRSPFASLRPSRSLLAILGAEIQERKSAQLPPPPPPPTTPHLPISSTTGIPTTTASTAPVQPAQASKSAQLIVAATASSVMIETVEERTRERAGSSMGTAQGATQNAQPSPPSNDILVHSKDNLSATSAVSSAGSSTNGGGVGGDKDHPPRTTAASIAVFEEKDLHAQLPSQASQPQQLQQALEGQTEAGVPIAATVQGRAPADAPSPSADVAVTTVATVLKPSSTAAANESDGGNGGSEDGSGEEAEKVALERAWDLYLKVAS